MSLSTFDGRVAAVTGAASGIGAALARELARRGADLALCDVDETGLAATAEACRATGRTVTTNRVDVADRQALVAWAGQVVADHGRVNLAVNNAGVSVSATVAAMSDEDLDWLMGINLWGVINGTRAFLPHLRASGEGHVVNLSSVFGLIGVPTQSAYNAAKFAVRGFTESLRLELELEGGPVSCTVVHPGGIRTNIVRHSRIDPSAASPGGRKLSAEEFDKVARTTPDRAATVILDAVRKNRARVLVGPDAWVVDLISRLPGRLYRAGTRAAMGHSG
jgi:butyryl-CoA dehydrogenase